MYLFITTNNYEGPLLHPGLGLNVTRDTRQHYSISTLVMPWSIVEIDL